MRPRIAIIGAGIAGATAARALTDLGHAVTIFEKARGPGGRMASRRTARAPDAPSFDHGCQLLSEDADSLPAEPWTHRLASIAGTTVTEIAERTRPVPTPRMNAPAAELLEGIDCAYATRIARVQAGTHSVSLSTESDSLGDFDALVITAPAPQTRDLLERPAPSIAERAAACAYDPCWTLMLERVADAPPLAYDAAHVTDHPVAWLCLDSAKPGRLAAGPHRWIAQFGAEFSRRTIDEAPGDIARALLAAAQEHLGAAATLAQPPHRWRYAFVTGPVGEPCLAEGRIVAAGDWLLGDRAHHAARSGAAAADAVASMLG